MKHLKSFEYKNLEKDLERYEIENFTIHKDGTIDVDGDVNLAARNLTKIPFKFGKVTGGFYCFNNKLDTLEGCPLEVGKDFQCYANKLTSLEYCPQEIGNSFDCSNNEITSLRYCPQEIVKDFDCSDNLLSTLEYCPSEIGRHFDCTNNCLSDLDISSIIGGNLNCYKNEINPKKFNFYGEIGGRIVF